MSQISIPQQLPLSVRLDDSATFDNFYLPKSSNNHLAIHALKSLASGDLVYLWGHEGAGRSHLLQAYCHWFKQSAMYLPLTEFSEQSPEEVLANVDQMPLVILDDLHAVSQSTEWAEQLFHLYNRLQEQGHILVVSANVAPGALQTPLADLQSRMSAMQVFRLDGLDDQDKLSALIYRAANRGLELSDKVASYLLTHYPRDMSEQIHLLDQLDKGSLQAKRKLTIPLAKEVLQKSGIEESAL